MIKLGMIGLNEGNGHPFSYSALFNGYDPHALQERCPFPLIREYLPKEHRNEVFIEAAKVTHIWTQDRKLSEDVSRVSLIPNIVSDYVDMIGKVDAVILARDDPWNHLEMARPFIRHGLPLFLDKQLTSTPKDLSELIALTGREYPLMAGSSIRFTRDLAKAKEDPQLARVTKSIHGVSRTSWMRYGHHLFEGVACVWGLDIAWVRSLGHEPHHDIVQIWYSSGMSVILEFIREASLPIQFTCFSEERPPYTVPFTDYFHSFFEMMRAFADMVSTGSHPIPFEEIVGIARVILAGDISRRLEGVCISPQTLLPLISGG